MPSVKRVHPPVGSAAAPGFPRSVPPSAGKGGAGDGAGIAKNGAAKRPGGKTADSPHPAPPTSLEQAGGLNGTYLPDSTSAVRAELGRITDEFEQAQARIERARQLGDWGEFEEALDEA